VRRSINVLGYVRAHHVGLLALMVALGGTSYAAVSLRSHSVGAPQLKNGAVTGAKLGNNSVVSRNVKDRSLLARDFKAGQLPAGPRGLIGAKGDKGDTGAIGATGQTGAKGDSFDTGLPSGKTLRGTYEVTGQAAPGGGFIAATAETYAAALPANPELHMIVPGATPPTVCQGTFANPQAAPGHLCVYESPNHGNLIEDPHVFIDPTNTAEGKLGFGVQIDANAAGVFSSAGTWAVTAP
jgi:hypothetical protein